MGDKRKEGRISGGMEGSGVQGGEISRRDVLKGGAALAASAFVPWMQAGCAGNSAVATPYQSTISQMTPFIEQQMTDNAIKSSLSIALVDDHRVVWAQGFGYADAANRVPATAETQYAIASVSKLFGGTMIMQLSDQGKLTIGDSITRYIPTFSIGQPLGFTVVNPQPITIRSMLNHHSGIPGDVANWNITSTPDRSFNDKLIAYLKSEYLAYPTNFILDYSNSAVALLSTVIAAASGQSFEAYSEALLQTLGMDHSSFFRESQKITGFQAKSYAGGQEIPQYSNNVTTAGSVISSVLDMAKFIKMVHAGGMGERGRVLEAATLETMLTQTNGGMPLDGARIGLSWFLDDAELDYAGKLCWHSGAAPGFVSRLVILREPKLGVVVLMNDAAGSDIVPAVARQALKLALAEKSGIAPPDSPSAYAPLVAWDQARLDALQGIYIPSSPAPGCAHLNIRSVVGELEWSDADGKTVHVAPRANGRLSDPVSPVTEYEFRETSGRRTVIAHHNGQSVFADYYEPVAIPAAWRTRLGAYSATNWVGIAAGTPLELAEQNGMLVMTISKPLVLMPLTGTLAYVRGLGRNQGSAVQVLTLDGHEEIQFLGTRYRKN